MTTINHTIYEFAYATGVKVIAPRRHRRHALDLERFSGPSLKSDFSHHAPRTPQEELSNADTALRDTSSGAP